MEYRYDASGNRVYKGYTHGGVTDKTWYVRDAAGNVLAVYGNVDGGSEKYWKEQHLYGSSRLGIWEPGVVLGSAVDSIWNKVGLKRYELVNHLGNVLATVSDKAVSEGDYYRAEVLSAGDYYPFGMGMMDRKYTLGGYGYGYGFNGKENDNEVKGEGNEQDYGMRVYDGRVGRFLSVDPLTREYPELTTYQFASNRPIQGIDLDGGELKILTSWLADKAKAGGHPVLSGFVNSFGSLDVNSIMYNRWKILLTGDIEGAKKEAYGLTGIGFADNTGQLVKSAYNGNEEAQGEVLGLVVQIVLSKRLSGERGRLPPPDKYVLSGVSIGKIANRKAFAKQWFIDSGKMGAEVEKLSETINFSNPVREKILKVGDRIWRFERENATSGTSNFYTDAYGADAGAKGVGLGDPKGYHLVEYQVVSETKVLESTIRSTGQKQFFSIDLNKNIKEVGREVAQ